MRLSLDLHNTRKEHLSKKETKQIRSVSQIEVTKSRSNSKEKVEKRSESRESADHKSEDSFINIEVDGQKEGRHTRNQNLSVLDEASRELQNDKNPPDKQQLSTTFDESVISQSQF